MAGRTKIIDAWAMLAWLLDQPGAVLVERFMNEADAGEASLSMSWINAGEVFYIVARRLGELRAQEFLDRLPSLPVRMMLPDQDAILAAARIKAAFRLSYCDAFAVALAQAENGSVVTGDPEILACGLVPVEWIDA